MAAKRSTRPVNPNAKPATQTIVVTAQRYQRPMAAKNGIATALPSVKKLMPTTAGTTVLSLRLRLVPTAVPRARLMPIVPPNVPSAVRPNATPDII